MQQGDIHLQTNNTLPLHHSIYWISILADYLNNIYEIEAETLLSGTGISTRDLNNNEAFITPAQELQVFRNAVRLIQDPKLGLIIGNQFSIIANNIVTIPAIFCTNLLDVMASFSFRYIDLTSTYFRWNLEVHDNLAFLRAEELINLKDIVSFVSELEFVSTFRSACFFLGHPLHAKEIRFSYPRPIYSSHYQDIFQCPLVFGAEHNIIIFNSHYLFEPLPMSNSLIKQAYDKQCNSKILRLQMLGSTIDRIKHELIFHEEGVLRFNQLAHRLSVSPRTLRRHLATHGISYMELLKDYRKNKAIDWLKTTNSSIERIATELGYSDVPNFYHAFKQWTGTTPSKFRELERQEDQRLPATKN